MEKMSLFGLNDQPALHSEDPLPGFCQDMFQNSGDLIYSEHPHLGLEPTLSSTDAALEDNLDRLSLSPRAREDSSDSDSLPSLQGAQDLEPITELGILCPKPSGDSDQVVMKPRLDATNKGKCPQTPVSECRVCGKVFASASSLSKHCLTHSQERTHICKVCSKAFKRQDHLTGHMLTHLKTKPFMCMEQGCNKSYCDFRSLRRHCEVQHGVCTFKEIPRPEGQPKQDSPSILTPQSKPIDPSPSSATLPNKDLLRCLVTSIVQQKIAPSVSVLEEQNTLSSTQSCHVSQKAASKSNNILKECTAFQNNSTSSSTFTVINASSNEATSSLQHPGSDSLWLDLWPSEALTGLPIFRSQKIQSKQNFWVRNTAIGAMTALNDEPEGDNPKEICLGSLNKVVPAPVKDPVDNPMWSHLGGEWRHQPPQGENTFQRDAVFTKLVLQPHGNLAFQDQNPGPQHLIHLITTSQQSVSHNQITTPTNVTVVHSLQKPAEALNQPMAEEAELKSLVKVPKDPEFMQSLPCSSNRIQDTSTFEGHLCIPNFGNLGNHMGTGDRTDRSELQLGKPLTSSSEASSLSMVGKSQVIGGGGKTQPKIGKPRRTSAYRRDKMKFNLSSSASPSQVALASFSVPSTSSESPENPNLTICEKIQGENICSVQSDDKDRALSSDCPRPFISSLAGNESQAPYVDCTQVCFQTHVPSSDTSPKNEQTLTEEELEVGEMEQDPPLEALRSPGAHMEEAATSPLVIPVSVPVTMTKQQKKSKACERGSQEESISLKRGKKKRPGPKALFIPPPLLETPTSSGCYQSNLRSPNTYLSEHLHNGLFQYPPYTPPPMLSPIRQGTGLYFSTLCPPPLSSTGPNLPEKDKLACRMCLVRDDTVFTIQPHINIGDRFQAKIPDPLDTRLLDEEEEDKASLLWRPWEDADTVSQFINLACSSAVPGGGTNLELALHCLHRARGNIMDALDKLLVTGPQKSLPQSLADYHYAGSDSWTTSEKRLFKRIFCTHRKDFSLMQNMIPTKDIYQCVEYYYTWKKLINFDKSRAPPPERRHKKGTGEVKEESVEVKDEGLSETVEEQQSTAEIRPRMQKQKTEHVKDSPPCNKQEGGAVVTPQAEFACAECDRVFGKVKSRNAHMKRHRQQEQAELSSRAKWVPKHPKKEESQEDTEQTQQGNPLLPVTSLNYWLGFDTF
ncbi:zinc finger protein 541 [Discoglossus pictus]